MMYNLLIEDFETDEIVKVKSPVIPVFRQSISFYDKNGEKQSRFVRFVDHTFNKEGDLEYIRLYVKEEIGDDEIVE